MERKNVWKEYDQKKLKEMNNLCESYKDFISKAKTERLCVDYAIAEAKEAGAIDLNKAIKDGSRLEPGDKFYIHHMNKLLIMGIMGKEPMDNGMNILGAHIDSPRMDIKQNPLYETADFAFLDTHYYGGIKKYQWVTLPLAIYGVIAKKDGKVINVAIGDEHGDPVFCVTDLLIHLAGKQMNKNASVVIEGEALDILIGSQPLVKEGKKGKEVKDAVKANILEILKKKYKIEEEDFISAELEVVPAGCARDLGFDRSMIIGYGHDDRVCAYTSYKALLDSKTPNRTAICLLTDKEEVGSIGATGMESKFFEDVVSELMHLQGEYSDIAMRRCLRNSCVLSSDVSAGFDPAFGEAFEKKNTAFLGRGICFNKFTGSRGKGGSNDANAEYIGKLRQILDKAKICWQTAELGKVDEGGGGTIAYILANYGMNVIDSGVAVLCMHSPWEIASKADIYEAYRCYKVFLQDMVM